MSCFVCDKFLVNYYLKPRLCQKTKTLRNVWGVGSLLKHETVSRQSEMKQSQKFLPSQGTRVDVEQQSYIPMDFSDLEKVARHVCKSEDQLRDVVTVLKIMQAVYRVEFEREGDHLKDQHILGNKH
eukprot:TRINITY_DN13557_c0_g1_i1.p2 TRINITY_DN13557_c0_g1~~TRINITY_DN13557_c0_g1_i1.p2  ORF type:complete len:126 (-),score=9.31 TRINITY_DN13557_c0_g1_i1:24-401(-)